jgi:hypothetical protein
MLPLASKLEKLFILVEEEVLESEAPSVEGIGEDDLGERGLCVSEAMRSSYSLMSSPRRMRGQLCALRLFRECLDCLGVPLLLSLLLPLSSPE